VLPPTLPPPPLLTLPPVPALPPLPPAGGSLSAGPALAPGAGGVLAPATLGVAVLPVSGVAGRAALTGVTASLGGCVMEASGFGGGGAFGGCVGRSCGPAQQQTCVLHDARRCWRLALCTPGHHQNPKSSSKRCACVSPCCPICCGPDPRAALDGATGVPPVAGAPALPGASGAVPVILRPAHQASPEWSSPLLLLLLCAFTSITRSRCKCGIFTLGLKAAGAD
jgi:hypothetical protein